MYDVITLGETMLRLTPASGQRIEQATQFDLHVGGSESNTAAGLARLGHRVAWISRLTDNPLGRKLAASIAAHGVDTGHLVWTDQDRIGTYYFEPESPPRSSQVIYDRSNSSFSNFAHDKLPKEVFVPGNAKWLHVTGISLALGPTCQSLIHSAVQLARMAGWRVSFDVNYRAKLWAADQAERECRKVLEVCDLAFLPIRDVSSVFRISQQDCLVQRDPEAAAQQALEGLARLSSAECMVVTLGKFGAAARANGQFHYQPAVPVKESIGRLGGGDAFSAGFLSAWMETGQIGLGLRRGNAAAALKYSQPGDLPYFTRNEVINLESCIFSDNQTFR